MGQDVFYDKHDDEANVNYRNNEFLPKVLELEKNAQVYLHLTRAEALVYGVKEEDGIIIKQHVWVPVPQQDGNESEDEMVVEKEFLEIHVDKLPDTPETEHLLLKTKFRAGLVGKRVTFVGQDEAIYKTYDDEKYCWSLPGFRTLKKKARAPASWSQPS